MADPAQWLVETEWLARHLDSPDIIVLDGSTHLPTSGRNARSEYTAGHIPGAYFFGIDEVSDKKNPLPQMLPSTVEFASQMKAMGIGDGSRDTFELSKRYGTMHAPYRRPIAKPVAGTIRLALDGVLQTEGEHYDLDPARGYITFRHGHIPDPGVVVTAGFEFDVPVRFDTDKLEINLSGFRHGAIPSIPIVELRV